MGGWLCTRRRSVVVVVSLLLGCCPLAVGLKKGSSSRVEEVKQLMDGDVFMVVGINK
jgi:hypothetical protein